MHILVSWIGHADLRAMAAQSSPSIQAKIGAIIGSVNSPPVGMGPVRTLLDIQSFDHIYLLSNYSKEITSSFVSWLGHKAEACYPALSNPTDYGEIFTAVDKAMQDIVVSFRNNKYELSILLSPGTPAMAAIWVLLGKTKYPARFYQTYQGKAWLADIPFDLTVDFLPELLRGPDRVLQQLASRSPQEIPGFERISGDTEIIRAAVGRARKAALRDVPVLLLGESGTGKEMFARAIHDASHRRSKPFLAMNCAAIPKALIESELFGHEKGAFTGADRKYEGAFQRAHGGTLFLDEVGEFDPDTQAKLLRVLQPPPNEPPCIREFQPIGAAAPLRTDVRVVAATNRDLLAMVQDGDFRDDLFYRLAVITIKLPSLKERKADIAKIADDLLKQINRDFERQEPGYRHKSLSDSAKIFVSQHLWPGNVRELYNTLLQAAVMSESNDIEADELQAAIAEMPSGRLVGQNPLDHPLGGHFSLEHHLETIQRNYLQRAMREAHGVKSKAARLLGMKNYQTLDAQLKRLEVDWEET